MQSNQGVRLDGDSAIHGGLNTHKSSETNHKLAQWREPTMGRSLSHSNNAGPTESTSKQSGIGGMGSNALADFFSAEVFQIVLHNPTTAHQLLKFSQSRFCGENMEFLEMVRPPLRSPPH